MTDVADKTARGPYVGGTGPVDAAIGSAPEAVVAHPANPFATIRAAYFPSALRLTDASTSDARILYSRTDATIATAAIHPAHLAGTIGLTDTGYGNTSILRSGTDSTTAVTAVGPAGHSRALRLAHAQSCLTQVLWSGTIAATATAAIGATQFVDAVRRAVLTFTTIATKGALSGNPTRYATTVQPAGILPTALGFKLWYADARGILAHPPPEAVAAVAGATVRATLFFQTLRLADARAAFAKVEGASTRAAQGTAPVISTLGAQAVGKGIAACAVKADLATLARGTVFHLAPRSLDLRRLTLFARVIRIHCAGGHTYASNQAEEVLDRVGAIPAGTNIGGARKSIRAAWLAGSPTSIHSALFPCAIGCADTLMVLATLICAADSAQPSTTVVAALPALAILNTEAVPKETDVLLVGANTTFVSTTIRTTAFSFAIRIAYTVEIDALCGLTETLAAGTTAAITAALFVCTHLYAQAVPHETDLLVAGTLPTLTPAAIRAALQPVTRRIAGADPRVTSQLVSFTISAIAPTHVSAAVFALALRLAHAGTGLAFHGQIAATAAGATTAVLPT